MHYSPQQLATPPLCNFMWCFLVDLPFHFAIIIVIVASYNSRIQCTPQNDKFFHRCTYRPTAWLHAWFLHNCGKKPLNSKMWPNTSVQIVYLVFPEYRQVKEATVLHVCQVNVGTLYTVWSQNAKAKQNMHASGRIPDSMKHPLGLECCVGMEQTCIWSLGYSLTYSKWSEGDFHRVKK